MEDTSLVLDLVSCIHYPVWFKNGEVWALINFGSEVNAMTPIYAAKLGLKIRHTNVKAQKIDGSTFETFGIVLASFRMEDKLERARFFQEMFLLADISIEVVLEIFFLTLSNTNI